MLQIHWPWIDHGNNDHNLCFSQNQQRYGIWRATVFDAHWDGGWWGSLGSVRVLNGGHNLSLMLSYCITPTSKEHFFFRDRQQTADFSWNRLFNCKSIAWQQGRLLLQQAQLWSGYLDSTTIPQILSREPRVPGSQLVRIVFDRPIDTDVVKRSIGKVNCGWRNAFDTFAVFDTL